VTDVQTEQASIGSQNRGFFRHSELQDQSGQQVGDAERYAAFASGALIALLGIRHRSVPGLLLAGVGGALLYHGATGRGLFGYSFGGDASGDAATATRDRLNRGVRVTQAFTITNKSPQELYQFWLNFENLPRFMTHLESVRVLDDRKSHWVAKAPSIAGGSVEWDAEMTEDVPNERIAWRSLPGADVDNAGVVRFEQNPRGTIVRVDMRYVAPAGRLGSFVAKLFGEGPERQIRENLRNFKQLMEVGEVPSIEGQSRGTCMRFGTRSP
jgi:uncharacterized membrane protein